MTIKLLNLKECFDCLEVGHTANNCSRAFKCKQEECGLPHHMLLHEGHASGVTFHSYSEGVATILQLQKIKRGKKYSKNTTLIFLWDAGSTISLITMDKAKELRLVGRRVRLEDKVGQMNPIEVIGIDTISTDIKKIKLENISEMFDIP